MTNPATPARLSCTTEIWPTKPVMTTSESAITTPISEFTSDWRKSNGSTMSATAHTTASGVAMLSRRFGLGTSGRPFSTSTPRPGRLPPRKYIAAMMISSVKSSGMPGSGTPPAVGNHERPDIQSSSEKATPMAKPAAHAISIDDSPASSAAPSAGTICSGRMSVSSSVIAAARIPTPPAISAAISELARPRRVGESPRSIPEISFSDAARVANPKRVRR
jgi:hypothetical protein